MSPPFKVIRCRYFDLDGTPVPPSGCNLGHRCTYLHPGDNGWPGRELSTLEPTKKRDDQDAAHLSRPRASRSTDQSKMTDSCVHFNPATHALLERSMKDSPQSLSIKGPPIIHAIVEKIHDVARVQMHLIQEKDQLDKVTEKIAAFRELAESLSERSTLTASAVKPTLDLIVTKQRNLTSKYEADAKRLSELWDDIMHIVLRAVCRQFDIEMESGTEFLRQQTHILSKTLHRQAADALAKIVATPTTSPITTAANRALNIGQVQGTSKRGREAAVANPPVGTSDNGWSHKRRRTSTLYDDDMDLSTNMQMIFKLQEKIDDQDVKIDAVIAKNEKLEKIIEGHYFKIDIDKTSATDGEHPRDEHLQSTLHDRIMKTMSPILEQQTSMVDQLKARIQDLVDNIQSRQGAK